MKHVVVIIGAGAGGLVLALTLSQFGIKPIVIDKNLERSCFTKAITMQPRTLEIADSFGLLKEFLSIGHQAKKSIFYVKGISVGSLDYTKLPSRSNYLLTIAQPEIEQVLEGAVKDQGITVRRGIVCSGVEVKGNKSVVKLYSLKTNKEEILDADYVIAADGAESIIRSMFLQKGLIRIAHEIRHPGHFIMGDFSMPNYPFSRGERSVFFKNRELCALAPMKYPYVRVIGFGFSSEQNGDPLKEEFASMTKKVIGKELDVSQGKYLGRFSPASVLINQFRVGDLFFVGDAAHIVSPMGAQGINLSIEDGYNLGWKLGMVMSKQLSLTILDTYSAERIEAAKRVFKETKEMHDDLSSSLKYFFFKQKLKFLKMPNTSRMVLLNQTQFFVDYPGFKQSPYAKNKNSLAFSRGMRLINARCLLPSKSNFFFDYIKKDCFTVVFNSLSQKQNHVNLKEVENTKKGVCSRVTVKTSHPSPCPPCSSSNIFVEIDPCSELYARLQKSPFFLVISPDRYVFETYASEDWHTMLNHMNTLIRHEETCEDIRNE